MLDALAAGWPPDGDLRRTGLRAGGPTLEERIALRETTVTEPQTNLDFVWTMLAAGLVLLMQAGFLPLEAGMVRSKISINVAQKNIADMFLAVIMLNVDAART